MSASASQVSKDLAAAGMTRASAYQPFGREVDGFVVTAPRYGQDVGVHSSIDGDAGQAILDEARWVLEAKGYTVTPSGRRIGRHLGYLEVTR